MMKAFSSSLLLWIAAARYAAAQDAYLYNVDIQSQPASSTKSSSIDSDTANAVLGRRLGATGWMKLGSVDDVVLEHLNRYGGQRTSSLFNDEDASSICDRLIVIIEGYNGESLPASPGVRIERANTNLASVSYMKSMIDQDSTRSSSCEGYMVLKGGVHVTYMTSSKVGPCVERDEILSMVGGNADESIVGDQKAIARAFGSNGGRGARLIIKLDMSRTNKKSPEARSSAIEETFNVWYKSLKPLAKAEKVESAFLLLPSERAPPTLNLNLFRRQTPQDEEEEPLSQPFASVSSKIAPFSASNSTHPLRPLGSLLPACFPSNDTCKDSTSSCSGHGFCYAKSSTCYSCKCGSTVVRQDSDGKNLKTVQWGGSACERKDVSVPFFLFAGFGVFMTALLVGAVGMMYSMGSEELPSVIGAGVTGPRAQK